ncbi:MAG: hypothetical protein GVY19_10580 [Bacteroidetes bacterium]|nr:hypothetical protein [Bacteroidota bacterium]
MNSVKQTIFNGGSIPLVRILCVPIRVGYIPLIIEERLGAQTPDTV